MGRLRIDESRCFPEFPGAVKRSFWLPGEVRKGFCEALNTSSLERDRAQQAGPYILAYLGQLVGTLAHNQLGVCACRAVATAKVGGVLSTKRRQARTFRENPLLLFAFLRGSRVLLCDDIPRHQAFACDGTTISL